MARIRTIKPEFPESESVGALSRDARLLFVLLWTFVDDSGRARASSRLLASRLYPYDDDAFDLIEGWLAELESHGHVRLYEVNGNKYLDIPNWLKHQKIDRPTASRLPSFDEASTNTREPSRALDAHTLDLGPVPRTKDHGAEEAAAPATRSEANAAFEAYQAHAELHGWPCPQLLNSNRRWALDQRLRECGGLAGWSSALDAAGRADFLRTKDGRPQPWFDLDWMLKPEKFTRLMEGRYAERHHNDREDRSLLAGLAGLAEAAR